MLELLLDANKGSAGVLFTAARLAVEFVLPRAECILKCSFRTEMQSVKSFPAMPDWEKLSHARVTHRCCG